MSGESSDETTAPALTDAEREALTCDCDETAGSPVYCPMHAEMGHLSPYLSADYLLATVACIKADAVAAALAPFERLADQWEHIGGEYGDDDSIRRADDLRAALAEGKGGERRG